MHPEWATYREIDKKNEVKVPQFRKYKDYKPIKSKNEEGKGAAFDFVLGKYDHPTIGIEFKWRYSWEKKPIAFDFLKCLDKAFESMETSISYNIIMRENYDKNQLELESRKNKFRQTLKSTYNYACNELKKINALVDDSRKVYLIITEIASDDSRLHWHYDKRTNKFKEDFPKF